MKIQIIIPSKKRKEKLGRCLNSIFKSAKDIFVLIDLCFSIEEEKKYFEQSFSGIPNIRLHKIDEYRVPNFWNGWLQKLEGDALLYLNDDVLLEENTLSMLIAEFTQNFPDYDGIVGITQYNIPDSQSVNAAFGAIGTKYADRFPNRQVFPIDYNYFFGDKEMWIYANKIGKFKLSSLARLEHLHPAFTGEKPDETHYQIRKFLRKDKETFRERQKLGLLWGETFKSIRKE